MAAFVERYLKLSNWGKVSLLKFGDMVSLSFTLHFTSKTISGLEFIHLRIPLLLLLHYSGIL